jgi:asparagine synthase (glutamine-hydrolysing)
MFRASRSEAFLDNSRLEWVDQLLSRSSLEATGYFDVAGVLRERARQTRYPRVTPKRIIMDLSLTCVMATQLWHHIYLGGGLCDLPTWSPTPLRQLGTASLDVLTPVEASLIPRG